MAHPIPALAQAATIQQTCEILQCSRPTIYRQVKEGSLDLIKIGGASRITMASINNLLGLPRAA